jgi:hypothetical protein
MSISEAVRAKIKRLRRATPFSTASFYGLGSRVAVQKALSRLAQEGVIRRVSRGYYVRPKPHRTVPSITLIASAEQVARKWASEHGYKITNQPESAAHQLGLQTQAPMRTVLWSSGPSREFQIGREIVEVRHVGHSRLQWPNRPEGELLRGLMVTPPESVQEDAIRGALKRLELSDCEATRVVRNVKAVPSMKRGRERLEQAEARLT